jgi:hypothetical protein
MEKTPREKLPYEPPVLKRIELRTEEVLGTGCKTEAESYSGALPCWSNGCAVNGS